MKLPKFTKETKNEQPIPPWMDELAEDDYTKYVNDTTSYYIPARLDSDTSEKVRALAVKIFRVLDCRGLSRVDFFAGEKGIIFNEINTLPGFTKISMYPKLMAELGVSYTDLIDKLIEFAKES